MSDRKTAIHPCSAPGKATAEDGVVMLDGPDGVAVAMTPDAAVGTAQSLLAAAAEARGESASPGTDADSGDPA